MSKIVIDVEVPEIETNSYRFEVKCGETSVDVYEHGSRGSDAWGVWVGNSVIENTGRTGVDVHKALEVARRYVAREEGRRRARAELNRLLDAGITP